ncbi:branched-chain amino acid ABC transporter permease, partial [Peribacillus frigoritolerans]|nr:branched-chain amino acid ABC transporter permease [Peribacillus frigoritolerans]
GGIGTLSGPLVGTLLLVILSQNLQFLQEYRMLIFGPLLTVIIIFYPRGIAGAFFNWQRKRKDNALSGVRGELHIKAEEG